MAMEFHGRSFTCAPDSIIPRGSSYSDPAFQGCSYQGVGLGQFALNGDDYIAQQFGFSFSNVGRDFGILFAFLIGLLVINMVLCERIDWTDNAHVGFESIRTTVRAQHTDEESTSDLQAGCETDDSSCKAATPMKLQTSNSMFSWQDLNYSVIQAGSQKQLLHNVTGFCEASNLTALVGPSGAGKSTCEFI